MRVLIVDDSAVMRRILGNAMSQIGATVITQAADGREAVEAANRADFDLVLMDWNMPNLSGFDALKEIRANGKKMPIIMVTTEAEKARVIDAVRAGANNYIIKPFTLPGVTAKIKDTLERARAA
ncbi:MAG: response regulator [Candidatus Eisenbacteria bacterium]|uniref:Response regulator n=1 Tax=Eiseniibacteriota bacterium TaxID=2212470 RepID=A0A948RZR2_UNCEI|nr:response regulator [Candidatus Eisenbacteria bacterium]MBU1949314.1 response regulator [Candidatus Eisenbacteria bacterium]MBU2692941.1 response regulator [Candidatus Eisenbacteria bacterium]